MINHKNAVLQLVGHGLDSRELLTSAVDRSVAPKASLSSSASFYFSNISNRQYCVL